MIKDKVIVVTGASQGLGRALSVKLSGMGAKVAMVARNEKLLNEVRQQLKVEGREVEMFICDVTNIDQVNETVKAIEKNMGTIDIMVNGAGIWTTDKFEDSRPELIENAFKVNSMGPIYFTKAVLPIFRKNNHGHLFYVISKAGLDIPDNKEWPTYAATKWAVTGYARALKYALEDTNIKLTEFYPGGFESNIFETAGEKEAHNQSWMMKTSEVVDAIVYALDVPEELQINTIGMNRI